MVGIAAVAVISEGEAARSVGLTEMQFDPEVARKFADDDQMVMQSGRPKLDIEEYMHTATAVLGWAEYKALRNEAGDVIAWSGSRARH